MKHIKEFLKLFIGVICILGFTSMFIDDPMLLVVIFVFFMAFLAISVSFKLIAKFFKWLYR